MEQHVVDLGIVVGHPQGQLSGHLQVGQLTGKILDRQQKVDFLLHLLCTACLVLLDRLDELLITLTSIMESRNGFDEPVNVKVCQIHLEFAEGLAGIAQDIHIRYSIVGDGRNKIGHTPEVASVHNIGLTVFGMMEMQGQLAGLLGPNMFSYLIDIVHQAHRIAECISIDVLHQERLRLTLGQHKVYFISTVDIAHLDGFVTEVLIVNTEESADFQQLIMKIHNLLLSVFSLR